MENIGSNLRMGNIYFSELSFAREEYIKDSFEINHSIDVEHSFENRQKQLRSHLF